MAVAYTLLHAVLHGDGAAPLSDAMAAKLRRSVDLWYAVIPPCVRSGTLPVPQILSNATPIQPVGPPPSLSQPPRGRT